MMSCKNCKYGVVVRFFRLEKRNGQWLFFHRPYNEKQKHRDLREDMWLLLLLIENKGEI
jgi:hypothetical protein